MATKGGATREAITKTQIEDLQIIKPEISLQNKFATIAEKIECIKEKYTQSLGEFENLFGSLSQKAFKGELDLSRVPLGKFAEPGPDEKNKEAPEVLETIEVPQKKFTKKEFKNIIKNQVGSTFSFDEIHKDLEKLNFNNLPEKKTLQDYFVKLLEAKNPIIEQVFAELTSDINNIAINEPEKKIVFKVSK